MTTPFRPLASLLSYLFRRPPERTGESGRRVKPKATSPVVPLNIPSTPSLPTKESTDGSKTDSP